MRVNKLIVANLPLVLWMPGAYQLSDKQLRI